MSLNRSLQRYKGEVLKATTFISRAHKKKTNGEYLVSAIERNFITSASFLVLFMGWEKFLEEATIKYMRGKKTISGHSVIRHVRPINDEHAHAMLIGSNKYVDWSNPEIVRRLSNLVFTTTNPINSVLSSIQSDLFDLKTIRNSAAHLSSTTSTQLDALASRKLGVVSNGITVANLILDIDPNATPPNITILDTYIGILDSAATNIAT